MIGSLRFAAVYLISIFGSSVAVLWLSGIDTWVVGASGGLFGLMAAYFVILRRIGADSSQMVGLIAINFAFGFFIPGISWQGHLGGLLSGAAVALVYAATRSVRDRSKQVLGIAAVAAALVAIAVAGYVLRIAPALPFFISQ
jgi:membrane associated rhomboid family serine protease